MCPPPYPTLLHSRGYVVPPCLSLHQWGRSRVNYFYCQPVAPCQRYSPRFSVALAGHHTAVVCAGLFWNLRRKNKGRFCSPFEANSLFFSCLKDFFSAQTAPTDSPLRPLFSSRCLFRLSFAYQSRGNIFNLLNFLWRSGG